MNIHPDDPKLTAYVLGELDETERAEIQRAIVESESLRQAVEGIRETVTVLESELSVTTVAGLTSTQREAIEKAAARTNGADASSAPLNLHFFRRYWVPLSVAASVVVVLGVGASTMLPSLSRARELSHRLVKKAEEKEAFQKAKEAQFASVDQALARREKEAPMDLHMARSARTAAAPEANRISGARSTEGAHVVTTATHGNGANDAKLQVAYDKHAGVFVVDANAATRLQSLGYVAAGEVEQHLARRERRRDDRGFAKELPLIEGSSTESYDHIRENPFLLVTDSPLSTFSIDVDTASYANVRRFLNNGQLPPPGAIRIEEMINYFDYQYPQPGGEHPFSVTVEVAECPWNGAHRLARIGLKGYEIPANERPPANLVFLIDVSGSMDQPNKLPLLQEALKMMVTQLTAQDQVAMIVYAGATGLALPPTSCRNRGAIVAAIDHLKAGGSTNGGAGIQLAYDTAISQFIESGVNSVVLATDGDFNVGVTSQDQLVGLIEEKAKSGVFLSVLGFGMGNLKDSTLEKLADKGNGNYAYIDTIEEAQKVLVDQVGGTLVTIAKDVKIQVEFNPAEVAAYRLIGYENRMLAAQDFNDDKKDAGEIGAGHTVTAFYEIVPAGQAIDVPSVDPLKYQTPTEVSDSADSGELMTVKLRYKEPDGDISKLLAVPVSDTGLTLDRSSDDFAFAAAVAGFGLVLRKSEHTQDFAYSDVIELASTAVGDDPSGYRAQFVELVRAAMALDQR